MNRIKQLKLMLLAFIAISVSTNAAVQGTSFTYQGEILENGSPLNGSHFFRIEFYDSLTDGVQVASSTEIQTTVTNGLFTLEIDIGDLPFNGNAIWAQIVLNPTTRGTPSNVVFTPRHLITNTPYAIQSQYVGINGVSTFSIQDGAVTAAKLDNNSVTSIKLANNSVTSSKIGIAAVGSSQIAAASVGSTHIVDLSVATADLNNNAVTTDKILDGAIKAIDIDSTQIQERVSACPTGSSIRVIAENGNVTCEVDDNALNAWSLSGNSGISASDFMGTTDNTDLLLKVNNNQMLKLTDGNSVLGVLSNTIALNSLNSSINGGKNNEIVQTTSGALTNVQSSSIGGGTGNQIIAQTGSSLSYATISGGNTNQVVGTGGTISGGELNITAGVYSTVPGGLSNTASGNYSFAAGFAAKARNHGSFVWNDFSDNNQLNGMSSTAINQFLVRAEGGFGIGINTPASPLHIKGQGTSTGSTVGSNEVVMTLEPKETNNNVAVVINKLDTTKESSLIFSTAGTPNFDMRMVVNGSLRDELQFNHYAGGTKQTLMSFDYFNSPSNSSIFLNADVFPDNDNTYDFGTTFNRWRDIYTTNIHTTNAVDVDSDRRLKDEIKNINYGLADILAMRPVSYYLKADDQHKIQLGLIAQEVEMIIPEIVNKSKDKNQMRSMSYTELVPVLIKATQEQQTLIEQQNRKIAKLEVLFEKLIQSNNN